MNSPRRLAGIIGAIGSGKTTVARMLAELAGAPLLIGDEVARELAQPGGPLAGALAAVFPGLDRTAIAGRIFTDSGAMRRLAAVTDPPMRAELLRRLSGITEPLVVIEGANLPVLLPDEVEVWLEVAAPEDVALARAAGAHHWPPETIRACQRWQRAQPAPEPRHVINNDGTVAALQQQVRGLYDRIFAGATR